MAGDEVSNVPGTVRLCATQLLRSIDATHDVLMDHLAAGTCVVVDASCVEEADLTFIQLMVSARKTAEHYGATLSVKDVPSVLTTLLARSGIKPGGECDPFTNGGGP